MNAALSELEFTLWGNAYTVVYKCVLRIAAHCTKTFQKSMHKNTAKAMGYNQHFHLLHHSLFISLSHSLYTPPFTTFPCCSSVSVSGYDCVWEMEQCIFPQPCRTIQYRQKPNCVSVSFLSLFVFHPSLLSIFFYLLLSFLGVCCIHVQHFTFSLCMSLFIIISVSAVPHCWESKVIFFLPSSSSFLSLFLAL